MRWPVHIHPDFVCHPYTASLRNCCSNCDLFTELQGCSHYFALIAHLRLAATRPLCHDYANMSVSTELVQRGALQQTQPTNFLYQARRELQDVKQPCTHLTLACCGWHSVRHGASALQCCGAGMQAAALSRHCSRVCDSNS